MFVTSKTRDLAPDAESRKTPRERWVEEELLRPGILLPKDIVDGCHAMSPSYLADQFERTLGNLGLATLDLLYLHNAPDAQIPVRRPRGVPWPSRRGVPALRNVPLAGP